MAEGDILYTIGYQGRSVNEFIRLLLEHGIKVVVDVRNEATKTAIGFSKDELEKLLSKYGIVYIHVPGLGVPKGIRMPYKRGLMSHEAFKQWYIGHIEETKDKWLPIIENAKRLGKVALLCAERYPTPRGRQRYYCHRHFLADYLIKHGLFSGRYDIV